MRKPASMKGLEKLGRVRLSRHFFMRDMLYSEIASFHGIPNIPDDPDLAIAAGTRLCEELLEPLHATFGHVSIRSAFRSVTVNDYGVENMPRGSSIPSFFSLISQRILRYTRCSVSICANFSINGRNLWSGQFGMCS